MASSGAVLYLSFRAVSGLFSTGATGTVQGLKNWRPAASVPLVDKDGRVTPEWYRYFRYQDEQVLGGASSPTLPDVEAALTVTQAESLFSSLLSSATSQLAIANAQSLKTTIEVVQNNALPGAESIPPVVLQPADVSRGGE